MFEMYIDGLEIIFCDNEVVYKNAVLPETILSWKHLSIAYHRCCDAVAAKMIQVDK